MTDPAEHPFARAALTLIASEFMFACMGVCIRLVSAELPNEMVVFMRNFTALLVLLPWILHQGISTLATEHLRWHLLRSLAGLSAMYCFFYAIANLPLAEAMLLKLTSPLFIPLIAGIWLLEQIPPRVRWGIMIGFVGVAVILRPGLGVISTVALVGVAGGVLAALAKVTIRRMAATEPASRIVIYFTTIAALVSAVPLGWAWVTPSLPSLLLLGGVGLFATLGQLLMTRAYKMAPASHVGPFAYTAVIFGGFFGWIIWSETPDTLFLVGALLIVAASILIARPRFLSATRRRQT